MEAPGDRPLLPGVVGILSGLACGLGLSRILFTDGVL